jgi:hypothetical protein
MMAKKPKDEVAEGFYNPKTGKGKKFSMSKDKHDAHVKTYGKHKTEEFKKANPDLYKKEYNTGGPSFIGPKAKRNKKTKKSWKV